MGEIAAHWDLSKIQQASHWSFEQWLIAIAASVGGLAGLFLLCLFSKCLWDRRHTRRFRKAQKNFKLRTDIDYDRVVNRINAMSDRLPPLPRRSSVPVEEYEMQPLGSDQKNARSTFDPDAVSGGCFGCGSKKKMDRA